MAYLNEATLLGNLGKAPEVRLTPSGKKRLSFSLATSKRYRYNNGEQKELTYWHSCTAWGNVADTIEALNLQGGTALLVRGEITYNSYDKDGKKVTRTEINVSNVQVLTPKAKTEGNGNATQARSKKPATQPQAAEDDDDLPF